MRAASHLLLSMVAIRYRAVGLLGTATATLDSEGAATVAQPWQHVTLDRLASALPAFTGRIAQVHRGVLGGGSMHKKNCCALVAKLVGCLISARKRAKQARASHVLLPFLFMFDTLAYRGGSAKVPPMYSALQQNGKRLYELAREVKTRARSSIIMSASCISRYLCL
jgi:hypothetical protein